MSWNLFSLVLAGATSWSLLLLGYLPVATVRRLGSEPIKATGAWAVVAATAPAAIFHWYLIFALICLVGWRKLERPAGKMWLAAAAALGLSLGVIFPLETSLSLRGLQNPLALTLLYLGGATIGQAYMLAILAKPGSQDLIGGRGVWLALSALAWTVVLAASLKRFYLRPPFIGPPTVPSLPTLLSAAWAPLAATFFVLVLAPFAAIAVRQQKLKIARGLAIALALVALAASLLDLSSLLEAEAGPLIQY